MKASLFALYFSLFVTITAAAQKGHRLLLGTYNSLGTTWIKGEWGAPEDHPHTKLYSGIGVRAGWAATERWGVEGTLSFSKEGDEFAPYIVYDPLDRDMAYPGEVRDANYVRLSLKPTVTLGGAASRFRPYAGAGISVGYLAGGWSRSVSHYNPVYAFQTKYVTKRWDGGLEGSVGLKTRIVPRVYLLTGVEYYHGLTDSESQGTSYRLLNRHLDGSLSLVFGL